MNASVKLRTAWHTSRSEARGMTQLGQPYAPPADDGGEQGSYTRPDEALAQPNPLEPSDRGSAGSYYLEAPRPRVSRWARWRGAMITLLMVVLFGSLAIAGTYCQVPR